MRPLSILAAALALPATALARQADSHAIVGARVLTVSGASYARATIVIRDGFIEAGDFLDTRRQVTRVWIDGVAQPLETRHTRLYDRYKDRP